MDIQSLLLMFNGVIDAINEIKSHNQQKDEKLENALYSIYMATTETKHYISTLGRRKTHDKDKEIMLSKLWNEAGIKLRKIDTNLAQRCIIKADYWANPDEWTQGDIKASKISLDKIIKESRTLLEN